MYEIALSSASNTFSGQNSRRIECLYSCLNAAKSWQDTFLSIPPAQYVGFSALIYHCLARCLIGISRLTTYENPEWDCSLAREILNPAAFLDEMEKKSLSVKDAAGLDAGSSDAMDIFSILASRLRKVRVSHFPTLNDPKTTAGPLGTPPSDELSDYPMPLLDDDWFNYLDP